MKCILALIAAFSLWIVGARAAPVSSDKCYKVAGPSKMVVTNVVPNEDYPPTYTCFSKQHMDGQYEGLIQAPKNTTSQKFEFYACPAPSKEYPGSAKKNGTVMHHFGQLRSAEQPNMCVTIKARDNRSTVTGYHWKNGRLSLQPCKSSGDDLALQWFELRDYVNHREIWHRGQRTDSVRPRVTFGMNDGVGTLFNDPTGQTSWDGLILV